jgi:hypothetical protein
MRMDHRTDEMRERKENTRGEIEMKDMKDLTD